MNVKGMIWLITSLERASTSSHLKQFRNDLKEIAAKLQSAEKELTIADTLANYILEPSADWYDAHRLAQRYKEERAGADK